MKKVLALILALMIAVACFSACGEKKTGSDGEVPTLVWYVPGDNQPGLPQVMEAANKIVEKEIGAKIDMKFINMGDFDEKMRLKMAAGEAFDLCFTGYINVYTKAAQMGGLAPLDELLELTPALVEATPEFYWEAAKVDGKIYGVPNQQIVAAKKAAFIPKRLVEKYNVDVDSITEYKHLEPFMKAVYENEEGIWPWRNRNAYFKVNTDFEEIISIGIAIEKSAGKNGKPVKVVFTDDHPGMIEGMKIRHEWYKKGYIRPDVLSVTDDTADYQAGKYAMDLQTYKPGVETNIKAVLGEEVVACKNLHNPYISMGGGTSTMIGIGRNCKNKEKAIKFIELINTNKELYNLICFGIEGVHYDLTEDGFVKAKADSNYKPEADWKFGNQFNALVREGSSADVWEQTKKLNDDAIANGDVSPILGFVLDRTNIEAELSSLTSIRKQYATAYFVGAKSVEDGYDDYLKRMEKAGLQTVIDETQRQIDEFLAKKGK